MKLNLEIKFCGDDLTAQNIYDIIYI
jgi:hypothetical protein